MEQPFSSSKVTVEYFDPHDVYKLLAPGLIPRLPLRDLHWQSHAGPLRSINTLHVELVPAGTDSSSAAAAVASPLTSPNPKLATLQRVDSAPSRDDGFQTASIGGRVGASEQSESAGQTLRPPGAGKERRHQIPGLRRTPYLKVLLVRCDDNDTYKSTTRSEIREWIKTNTPPAQGKVVSNAENHDAFEWLILHVVIPNTVAATQPRFAGAKAPDSSTDITKSSATSRWRGGSSTLLDKLRSDFNGSGKSAVDRIRQIRIGINDVPYDLLPRVVPAVPTGYSETEQDSENAWADLIGKFKELILSSFDTRVTQYEEDIKEKDAQRGLPGWNFCTFFILKEGLARGFESVGLVEDALVGYDELSVGLDAIIQEQAIAGSAEAHGGALLQYTEELKALAQKALDQISRGKLEFVDEEAVDLQSNERTQADNFDDIPVSSTKKPYRELILANNVSLFDFRCYIFARQISLLLRLGNAWSTREELLAKLREQQELVPRGVAPRAPPPKPTDESENLAQLAEICRRALEFVPAVSSLISKDIIAAMTSMENNDGSENAHHHKSVDSVLLEVTDNIVASFAFSVAQQILAQTSTKALPIPPSTLAPPDGHEPKAAIPEPKTMMHPARHSSLHTQPAVRPPPSPNVFPGGRMGFPDETANAQYIKNGLEELAARRAQLYTLSRNILEEGGKKRGWSDGWSSVPIVGESGLAEMEDISLDDEATDAKPVPETESSIQASVAGVDNMLLRTALDHKDDFYRLYETLTDKALRHYTVANYTNSVEANMADLAVLKFHLCEYGEAAFYFYRTIPYFGESGWSLLELSTLVMYARCLKELRRLDDYANKALRQLLTKVAAAEKDRFQQKSLVRVGPKSKIQFPEASAISGFLADLLTVSASLDKEVRIPLASFFCDVELEGTPVYDDGQDSFSLRLRLRSLLVDEFEAPVISLRLVSPATGGSKEIWLQTKAPVTLKPGRNKVQLHSTVMMAGDYEADQIRLSSSNVLLHYERDPGLPPDKLLDILKSPRVTLYQRANSFDVRLVGTRDVRLDKNNTLDLELLTGWNAVTSCEVKIRSATGGLRLLMSEATVPGPTKPSKRADGGSFSFGPIPVESSVAVRFPYTVEQDVVNVAVKVEVTYSTEKGSFTFYKTSSVPIALALGVNVQDVFKHNALFSRFTVSTVSASPLRLFKSELQGSEIFDSHFGVPPGAPVLVFQKQPAGLLYKITRKPGSILGPKTKKTMYLKIYYNIVQEEIEALFEQTLRQDLDGTPLRDYTKLVVSEALVRLQSGLSGYDLEKAAILGELETKFLADVDWEKRFPGLGPAIATGASKDSSDENDGNSIAAKLAAFMRSWLHRHPKIVVPAPDAVTAQPKSILIPVDVPPVTVVHTADIRFQKPLQSVTGNADDDDTGHPTFCINQLIPATLHLQWTRIWDTAGTESKAGKGAGARAEDLEFSYELSAQSDTWLLGGRRKGHFVIPAVATANGGRGGLTSTPDTEADIPLMLIPLREGWLSYPAIEVREVKAGGGGGGVDGDEDIKGGGHGHCETDCRNLGETVLVVAERKKVTLSLDASGLGGGPLVLECERAGLGGRVVV
ncbi:trafficking protein particle complex subunit 10 [Cercophora scortea]|uniref:Trafficking protein particle complex subunit 10 n=1 Tax=Cercophora scortea TaxID=314031 RepID=A0AAE0M691_9PEZI|nr:trafficking protein particle complex subunit 10 [Cercophora scortea]